MKETRVYLNTVEDLTKALSEGKTVYAMDEFCTGESEIKLTNNILAMKNKDGSILINGIIYFKANVFYLKEKEPLKIEVGKFYKLAKGSKAFVYSKVSDGGYQVVEVGDRGYFEVSEYGKHKDDCPNYDIVDYWED